ncbi:MAG TPA: radical SAM protein [Methanosarcinales archaeon]|nr:radical SAM protein [Methanosarcinales archaeon]
MLAKTIPPNRTVRTSLGTLGVLGMELVLMDAPPRTAYLQIYTDKRCQANCHFCSQASGADGDLLQIARGQYIPSDLGEVMRRLAIAFERGYLKRACIQTMMYSGMWQDTTDLVRSIRDVSQIPISVSVFPLSDARYALLKELGADKLVIPLDACTRELFERVKGGDVCSIYRWERHLDGIKRASIIFGRGSVGTHLIIGMGERCEDALRLIDNLHADGVYSALFAYTRLPGTRELHTNLSIEHYRAVQFGAYLIREDIASFADMAFRDGCVVDFGISDVEMLRLIEKGDAFRTTGCPDCNRPYATETHLETFNFPKSPDGQDIEVIKQQMAQECKGDVG